MTRPLDPLHLHAAAARFGPAVLDGSMSFQEAFDLLRLAAWKNSACRAMPMPAFDDLCGRLADTLANAIDAPGLAASKRVRGAVRPLLVHRRPRAVVLLAAYRAARNDLTCEEIEAVAEEEVAAYVEERARA